MSKVSSVTIMPLAGVGNPMQSDHAHLLPNREVDDTPLEMPKNEWKPLENPEGIRCSSCPGGFLASHMQNIGDGTSHPIPYCQVGADSRGNPGFVDLNAKTPESWCPFLPVNSEKQKAFLKEDFEALESGTLYNTKGSKILASINNKYREDDPRYAVESLHESSKGNRFMVFRGGSLSPYAIEEGGIPKSGRFIISPKEETLKGWLEGHQLIETYRQLFSPEVEEG